MAPLEISNSPTSCIVLGSDPAARRIERDLAKAGFTVHRADPALGLPSPGDERSAELFRAFLNRVLERYPETRLLHPGTTLWAERPELPTLCQEVGMTAIAPPRNALSLFGNRVALITDARELGIDHLILHFDPLASVREVRQFALQHRRFPFVLKSVRGDADLTVFVVHSEEDIDHRLPLWMEQLQRNLGQSILVPERYVESARFIISPFARLQDGTLHQFPLVDASLQCGHKNLIEFCPAEGIDAPIAKRIRRWTRELADHSRYTGVGALHFLVDGVGAYLLGGSAKLDPEYHLWESVDGTAETGPASAVAWQVAAFRGLGEAGAPKPDASAAKDKPEFALVARIFAEDPLLRLPQPGVVTELPRTLTAAGEGWSAELSLCVETGEQVSGKLDGLEHGLIGSIWVGGKGRKKVLEGARQFLDSNWIAGTLQTNERYLAELMTHPFVKGGHFHAGFIDEEFLPPLRPSAEIQRVFATLGSMLAPQESPDETAWRWVVGNVLASPDASGFEWVEGPVFGDRNLRGAVRLASGETLRISAEPSGDFRWQVRVGLWWQIVRRLPPPATSASPSTLQPRKLSALVSGRIHSILYRDGAQVAPHEPLVIIESLRMLVPHAIPREGRIERWLVKPKQEISSGDDLAEITLLR